jgi:hypothetical protein
MKTVFRLLFVAGFIGFVASCNNTETLLDDPAGPDLKVAHGHGAVIDLYPSGGEDTDELIAAFEEAKAQGPGTTIRLAEGLFTISIIEVHEFHGALTGAGKGKTIIQNIPDLPCDCQWDNNKMPGLLTFVGGDVVVNHLTFHTQDGDPCSPDDEYDDLIYGELTTLLVFADWTAGFTANPRFIKGLVDDVEFIGGSDGGAGTYGTPGNIAMAIYCGCPAWVYENGILLSCGDISINNCYFNNVMCGPDIFGFDEHSRINISNNVVLGGTQSVFLGMCLGTEINIVNNEVRFGTYQDLFIWENDESWIAWAYIPTVLPETRAHYTITGNIFESISGTAGLEIQDYYRTLGPEGEPYQQIDIRGNTFITHEGSIALLSKNNKNAKIQNNQFLGSGSVGVMMDGHAATGTYAENNEIIGSNVFDGDLETAVWLGEFTKNCKVVGAPGDLVVDNGVDNKVIGTNAQRKGLKSMPALAHKFMLPKGHK